VVARVSVGLGFPVLAHVRYRGDTVAAAVAEIDRYFEPLSEAFELLPFLLLGLVCASLPVQALRRAVGLFVVTLVVFSAIYYSGYMSFEAYMARHAWTAASLAGGFVPMKCLAVVPFAFLARLVLGRHLPAKL
jgi:hypothetical protein